MSSFLNSNSQIEALKKYAHYHSSFMDIKEGEIYGKMSEFYKSILPKNIIDR